IPVIFDSGKKESPPEDFGILAELFPSAKIIMAHMYGNFLEVAKKHSNIYLQTTGMPKIDIIKNAVETLGAERIISGSDSPYISMERELEKIRSIPDLTDKESEGILGENIRRILKL
ncbi:MAG: amidohydrolase family protein, partial [Methanosarcinales archaeon]